MSSNPFPWEDEPEPAGSVPWEDEPERQVAPPPKPAGPPPAPLPEASYGFLDVLRQVPAALKDAPGELVNYGAGLLKGAGRQAVRGADKVLATPLGLGVGQDNLTALTGLDRQKRISRLDEMLGLRPGGGKAEKVGGVVSEAIPYFMPGAGAAKGAGLGRWALKAGAEGAKNAAIASGLQGATPFEAAGAGALGAVGQGITGAAEGAAPALRESAANLFQKAVQPAREHLKVAVERIAPEAVKRGIRGSLPEITSEAGNQVKKLGGKLESVYDRATGQGKDFDAIQLVQQIDDLRNLFKLRGAGGGTIRPQADAALDAIGQRVMAQGERINPRDLWETRKALDEIIAGASGAGFDVTQYGTKGATKRVSKAAGGLLQRELNTVDPRLAKLNKEFGFWNDLWKGAKATKTRRVGQESPLTSALVGSGVGAAVGGVTGQTKESAGLGALVGAAGGKKALDLMRTPAWRTASAQMRNVAANLIESGRIDDAIALLGKGIGRGAPAFLGDE